MFLSFFWIYIYIHVFMAWLVLLFGLPSLKKMNCFQQVLHGVTSDRWCIGKAARVLWKVAGRWGVRKIQTHMETGRFLWCPLFGLIRNGFSLCIFWCPILVRGVHGTMVPNDWSWLIDDLSVFRRIDITNQSSLVSFWKLMFIFCSGSTLVVQWFSF